MTKAWGTLLVAAVLALSACAGSSDDTATDRPSTTSGASATSAASSTSGASSPTGSADPNASETPGGATDAPDLPADHVWETVEDVSLTFAVPDSWSAIDPEKITESGDTSAMEDMAEKMGVSATQLMQVVGQADLMLLAPPKKGYADNISAIVAPLENLPTESQIKAQLGGVADGPIVVTKDSTPVGEVVTSDLDLMVGARKVHSRSHFIDTDDGVLNLTVSTVGEARGADLSKVLLSTIHRS